jgi:competence protein ComEC
LTSIQDRGLSIIAPDQGTIIYDNGAGTVAQVLSKKAEWEELNDYSIVIKLTCQNVSYLFMGDAEEPVEQALEYSGVDYSAEILKVGHHGSSSSSSIDFIENVNPRVAVVMVGAENEYNHPSQTIIDRITVRGTALYRTDINGMICVNTDGTNINVTIEKGDLQQ